MKKYKDVTKQYFEDATPKKGNIDYDKNYNKQKYKKEVLNALIIHSTFGGDILLISPDYRKQKSSDYIWNGELWELKNVSSLKAFDSAIRKGLKQIQFYKGGIIIDIGYINISIDDICEIIFNRLNRYNDKELLLDIIIIREKKIIKVIRV